MKRFWKEAEASEVLGGFSVGLDGRMVKTQGGRAQILPSLALARAMASEWAAQGEDIDPASFALRDLADLAIDTIAPAQAQTIENLLRYAETDTLCYRADPEDALHGRQAEVWDPLLKLAEARWDIHFERIHGVIHRAQPRATRERLEKVLQAQDPFTLAAVLTMASLAASLVIALAGLEADADPEELWSAAELEEDWQAGLWGRDDAAAARRANRLAAFTAAMRFAQLTRA